MRPRGEYSPKGLGRYKNPRAAAAQNAEWKLRNRARASYWQWRAALKRVYGLTEEQYDILLETQGGRCAICKTSPDKRRLVVDYCHSSGRVRGLLCDACNLGLGKFRDDPKILQEAARYALDR